MDRTVMAWTFLGCGDEPADRVPVRGIPASPPRLRSAECESALPSVMSVHHGPSRNDRATRQPTLSFISAARRGCSAVISLQDRVRGARGGDGVASHAHGTYVLIDEGPHPRCQLADVGHGRRRCR